MRTEYDVRSKIRWLRSRAAEVSAAADKMHYPPAKAPLHRVAATYEQTACKLEAMIEPRILKDVG